MGETNANDAVILSGLEDGDRVYLSFPAGQEDKEIRLLPEMNGKRKKEDKEEKPAETEEKKVVPTASVQN